MHATGLIQPPGDQPPLRGSFPGKTPKSANQKIPSVLISTICLDLQRKDRQRQSLKIYIVVAVVDASINFTYQHADCHKTRCGFKFVNVIVKGF